MSWNNDMSKAPKDRSILVAGGTFKWDDGDAELPLPEPVQVTWAEMGDGGQGWHVVHSEGTNMWVSPTHWQLMPDNPA